STFETSGIEDAINQGKHDERLVMLREQFRMHPKISDIVDQYVYGGKLLDHESTSHHTMESTIPHPDNLVLVDLSNVNPNCRVERAGFSRWNVDSAQVILEYLEPYTRLDNL